MTWLVSLLKSIPALAKLAELFVQEWREYDRRAREAEASKRQQAKDRAVDDAIVAARYYKLSDAAREAGERSATDWSPGVQPGRTNDARVDKGSTKDNQ